MRRRSPEHHQTPLSIRSLKKAKTLQLYFSPRPGRKNFPFLACPVELPRPLRPSSFKRGRAASLGPRFPPFTKRQKTGKTSPIKSHVEASKCTNALSCGLPRYSAALSSKPTQPGRGRAVRGILPPTIEETQKWENLNG